MKTNTKNKFENKSATEQKRRYSERKEREREREMGGLLL